MVNSYKINMLFLPDLLPGGFPYTANNLSYAS